MSDGESESRGGRRSYRQRSRSAGAAPRGNSKARSFTAFNAGFGAKRASNGHHTKKKGKKGKNNKQNDSHKNHNNPKENNKPITAVSNRNWSMMPAPYLDSKLITELKFTLAAGSKFELPARVYAYEAHCQDRQPNSYYVQIAGGSKYIAYVSGKENLEISGEALRTSASTLSGYVYHSTVIPYHDAADSDHKYGYITFMIPFTYTEMVAGLKSYVCAVKLPSYVEIKDKDDLLQNYGKYIMATDIALKTVMIKYNVLDTLKKTLHDIMDATVAKELHRTDNPWGVDAGSTANISQMIRIQNNQYMMMQCVVPYKKVTADYAKTVLARIAKKFLGIINSKPWQETMVTSYYSGKTYDSVKMTCIAKLWDITTLVLAQHLHLESMDKARTNNMANIFVKFANTYVKSKACPDGTSWRAAIVEHQKKRNNKHNEALDTAANGIAFGSDEYDYTTRTPAPKKTPNNKNAELDAEDLDHAAHDLLEFNDYSHYSGIAKRDWA